jgi:threonine dehydrogenase-like Zn-dependent dehydrogenase
MEQSSTLRCGRNRSTVSGTSAFRGSSRCVAPKASLSRLRFSVGSTTSISPFKPGDNVLVVGGGPIGIGIVQVLKVQGAREIIVVEPTENRRRLSEAFGATHLLMPIGPPPTTRTLSPGLKGDILTACQATASGSTSAADCRETLSGIGYLSNPVTMF